MLIAAIPALALALAATADPDPYAAPPDGEIETMLRAARFGEPGADAAIARWLDAHPDAAKADRARLAHRLCGDYGVLSMSAAAAGACAASTAAGADDAQDADTWAVLEDEPGLRAIGSARVPLVRNALGSRSATVTVNGIDAPWFMDTGAEITVVSQSLAERIGVRMLGKADVGSATGDVHGGLGMIDLLRIGDAAVENVPVFVLPDAQLTIAEFPTIPAILGLPVFVAFRRAAWLDGGAMLALGEAAPRDAGATGKTARLYWHEEGIGVPISTPRGILGAHLDTGANTTNLRAPAHALLDPETEASAVTRDAKIGGAGGVVSVRRSAYPELALAVAGAPVMLAKVAMDDGSDESAARLGDDIVAQLDALILDFERMQVTAAPAPR